MQALKRRKQLKSRVKKGAQTAKPSSKTAPPPDYDSEYGSDAETESEDEGSEGYKKGGYHPVYVGERYKQGRYTVLSKLGWGHFSTVWLVLDSHTGLYGAMKVQKSASHYTDAARDEVELCSEIKSGDPHGDQHCVQLLDSFDHSGPHGRHVCMVFEVLGDNILALIKRFNYKGIPIPIVRNLAKQMLTGLDYLHRKLNIIHTDFKPENVMLVEPLKDRVWELPVPGTISRPPHPASARAPLPSKAASTPRGSSQSLDSCEPTSSSSALTKNQKKKMKKKQKKATLGLDHAGSLGGSSMGHSSHSSFIEDEEDLDDLLPQPPLEPLDENDDNCDEEPGTCPSQDPGDEEPVDAGLLQQHPSNSSRNAPGEGAAVSPAASPGAETEQSKQAEPSTSAPPRAVVRLGISDADLLSAKCKLVDFGNACWTYKQFTTDIQTRQYRSPEVILGAKYSTPCDMWSLACMVFEMVTGDLLFDPRSGDNFDRDEDHLALFMELLGRMPKRVFEKGKFARDYFNRSGELRHIKRLKFWPLNLVLQEKYKLEKHEAKSLASFLMPMLDYVPEKRATAAQMLAHPWLCGGSSSSQAGTSESYKLGSMQKAVGVRSDCDDDDDDGDDDGDSDYGDNDEGRCKESGSPENMEQDCFDGHGYTDGGRAGGGRGFSSRRSLDIAEREIRPPAKGRTSASRRPSHDSSPLKVRTSASHRASLDVNKELSEPSHRNRSKPSSGFHEPQTRQRSDLEDQYAGGSEAVHSAAGPLAEKLEAVQLEAATTAATADRPGSHLIGT